jgi:hypothetical protein
MQTISLKLPEPLLKALDKESRARGITKSSLVRECIELGLRQDRKGKQPSCYDLSRDLIGSLKGMSPDLATNRKYMEGFGQ